MPVLRRSFQGTRWEGIYSDEVPQKPANPVLSALMAKAFLFGKSVTTYDDEGPGFQGVSSIGPLAFNHRGTLTCVCCRCSARRSLPSPL